MYESHPEEINTSLIDAHLSFTPVKEIGHNAIRCRVPLTNRQLLWVSPQRDRTHHTFQQINLSFMCITRKDQTHHTVQQIEPHTAGWGFEPTTSNTGSFALTNWATEILLLSDETNLYIYLIWQNHGKNSWCCSQMVFHHISGDI